MGLPEGYGIPADTIDTAYQSSSADEQPWKVAPLQDKDLADLNPSVRLGRAAFRGSTPIAAADQIARPAVATLELQPAHEVKRRSARRIRLAAVFALATAAVAYPAFNAVSNDQSITPTAREDVRPAPQPELNPAQDALVWGLVDKTRRHDRDLLDSVITMR